MNKNEYKLKDNLLDKEVNSRYKNIFSEINESSAYWLGYLWADGSLYKNILELELNSNDEDHLSKLAISLTGTKQPKIHRRFRHNAYTSRIIVSNADIANSLRELGFTLKGKRIIPKISEEMMIHFIRGYFDGDGSLQIREGKRLGYRADISGPKELIDFLENYLPKYDYDQIIHYKQWTSRRLYWDKKDTVTNLINLLSKNSTIKLERKYLLPH